jgi:dihydropyrimidinase
MSAENFDVIIKNGTVVNGHETFNLDIGVRGSRIQQIGGSMSSDKVIDAQGKFVLPGGIDPHVHLSSPRDPDKMPHSWTDDFYVGSLAAIAGGVTTFGNMTFPWPDQSLEQGIERDLVEASKFAAIDYFIHPVLTQPTPENLAFIHKFKDMGIKSLKIFLVNESFERQKAEFLTAIQIAVKSNLIVLLHCEDPKIIDDAIIELEKRKQLDLSYWSESRPVLAEVIAIENALQISKVTGATIYIVHISSEAALRSATRGKVEKIPIFVETRPMYLYLTKERLKEVDGAKYIGAPPLRSQQDADALWQGLVDGSIDLVGSDHAPFTLDAKLDPALDVRTARQGVSDLETSLPMLFSRGVVEGRISINRFVEITSTNPAKIFGISHQKGSIEIGKDADLVIWDPSAKTKIKAKDMASMSGYSVYEDLEITGRPETVLVRGVLVLEKFTARATPGAGKWLHAK